MNQSTTPSCPGCHSYRTRFYSKGVADRRRKITRPFEFFFCQACRLRFQAPRENVILWYEFQDLVEVRLQSPRRELRADSDVLRQLSNFAPGKCLLDVGSGDGRFLEAARAAGFDASGVDVSSRLAEQARRRSGAHVFVGELPHLDLPPESYDVVNFDQVIMYVPNPAEVLIEAHRLLRAGGICRIREYDADSVRGRMAGKDYWMYAPTQLLVWTRKAILQLAQKSGFRLAKVFHGTEASYAGWLAAERTTTPMRAVHAWLLYIARRLSVFHLALGADTVYYLRKPLHPGD